ncbi:MAG TPA: molecular chaperone DnaJ [Bacteroidales bacterium]|nr:MAG: molecular chaperone DnaJ [Bacteroidetes bacterium GWE2_42_24]OFY26766.1 MAG: molecular chaperone DnaJ [Bacteroidetes bacterium GWF2_43_11]HBZ68032.1 molecular chaperone DnaJ [Bacteroidales bacterium]
MDFVDYYQILEIKKTATPKEIKNAYRKLARRFHPDINPDVKDAKRKFQQINEANEVLSDPEKRAKYDQYGENWQHIGESANAGTSQKQSSRQQRNGFSQPGTESEFSSFFDSLFGGEYSRTANRKARGEDYNYELHLTLQEAFKTHKTTLAVNGRNIRITIPAGVENGQTIKLAGHGGPGFNGGPGGDLFITFIVSNDESFVRSGDNLYTTVELGLYTALLGGEIIVALMDGKVKVKIKPETQNGSKIRLTGKGFPCYKKEGQAGDLIITFEIKIPTNLTERQKALFTELAEMK